MSVDGLLIIFLIALALMFPVALGAARLSRTSPRLFSAANRIRSHRRWRRKDAFATALLALRLLLVLAILLPPATPALATEPSPQPTVPASTPTASSTATRVVPTAAPTLTPTTTPTVTPTAATQPLAGLPADSTTPAASATATVSPGATPVLPTPTIAPTASATASAPTATAVIPPSATVQPAGSATATTLPAPPSPTGSAPTSTATATAVLTATAEATPTVGAAKARGLLGMLAVSANHAPTISQGAVYSYPGVVEGSASDYRTVAQILAGIGYADVDAGAQKGIALISTNNRGSWQVSTNGTTWGTLNSVMDAGGSIYLIGAGTYVRYQSAGWGGSETATFTIRAWDKTDGGMESSQVTWYPWGTNGCLGGSCAYSSQTATLSVVVTPANKPPSLSGFAGAQSVQANASQVLTGLDVTHADAGDVRVDLSVSHGTLSAGTTTGLTVTGNGTASLSLTGPLSNLNTALDNLTYTPASGFSGSDTLVAHADDLGNTGAGGAKTADETLTLSVVDRPRITLSRSSATFVAGSGDLLLDPNVTFTSPNDGLANEAYVYDIDSVMEDGAAEHLVLSPEAQALVTENDLALDAGDYYVYVSGIADVATYQTIFRGVLYRNTSASPSTSTRVMNYYLTDGSSNTAAEQPFAISISVDAGPQITSVSVPNLPMKVGDTVTATITVAPDTDTYTLAAGSIDGFALSNLQKVNDTTYTAQFTVTNGGVDVPPGSDVPVSVSLRKSSGTANSPYTTPISQGNDWIDANYPTITSVTVPNVPMKIGDVVTATISVVSNADTYSLVSGTVDGFALTNLQKSSATTYTAQFSVAEGGTDIGAPAAITVSLVLRDAAGNQSTTYTTAISQANDSIDAHRPVVTGVSIPNSPMKIGDTVLATITVAADADSYTLGTSAIAGRTLVPASMAKLNDTTYRAQFSVTEGGTDCAAGADLPVSIVVLDSAGNQSVAYTTALVQANDLIDANRPVVTSVSVPANGTYTANQSLDFTVHSSEPVAVSGTPSVALVIDSTTRNATYVSGSGSSALTFRYTISSGERDTDGITVGALTLNGGSIRDAAGNDATPTLNSVGSTLGVLVDATTPTVASVSVPAGSTYGAGEDLAFTVTFSQAVAVTGAPRLVLDIGGATVYAAYVAGSGTTALTFRYTVQSGERDTDGIAVSSLELDGGTIRNGAETNALLDLHGVGSTSSVLIDGRATTSTTIQSTSPASPTVGHAATVSLLVHSSLLLTGLVTVADQDHPAVSCSTTAAQDSTVTCALTFTAPGAHSLVATFAGDAASRGSISAGYVVTAADDDAPAITTSVGTVTFAEDGLAVVVDPDLTLADTDDATLASATVALVAFPDGKSERLELTLAAQSAAADAGLSVSYDDLAGILTLEGVAPVETYRDVLRGVSYFNGSQSPTESLRTVSFRANDGTTTGPAATRGVVVVGVNDAPTLSIGTFALAGTDEDTSSSATLVSALLSSAGYADVDAGAASSVAVTGLSGNGTWQYSTDGLSWAAFGPVSDASALLLAAGTRVRYVPDAIAGETATLTFRAWDATTGTASTNAVRGHGDSTSNGGVTAYSTATSTASLAVASVNDAPLLAPSGPTLATITEDETDNSGQTVGSILGSSVTDVDAGAVEGLALTNVSAANGNWQYSLDAGATWSPVGAVSGTSALLLRDSDRLRFAPDGTRGTAATLGYHAWDQTAGTAGTKVDTSANGGTTAFSAATDAASLTVTDVNDAPILSGGPVALTPTLEDSSSTPTLVADVLAGVTASDPDGVGVTAIAVTSATGDGVWQYLSDGATLWTEFGSVSSSSALLLDAFTRVRFVPSAHWNGAATLTFRAYDATTGAGPSREDRPHYGDTTSNGGTTAFSSGTAEANLVVEAVNYAPVGIADSYSVAENHTLIVDAASGVLANDTDADADTLSAVLVGDVSHGTLTLNADGSFTYQPTAYWNGTDSFTYKTNDEAVDSSTTTVTITVTPVNYAPVAVADSYSIAENGTLTVSAASGALANDTDVDGDALTVSLVGDVSHGTLILNADGAFTYYPAAYWNGTDSFTYKTNDGHAYSSMATVALTVTPVNYAPVGVGDSYSTDEDSALTVSAATGVLANDTDVDGDRLTAVLVSGPAHGTLTFSADGTFVYTPDADWNGTDSFAYRANDGQADSNAVTVTITVTAVNDAPVLSAVSPTLRTITEDETANAGQTIVSILGASVADPDDGAVEGIALVATTNGNGHWEYSLAGATWTPVGSVSETSALLLRAPDLVRFVPNGIMGTTATLTYRAWDQTTGTAGAEVAVTANGGSTSFSAATDRATLVVSDVNDAPTLTIPGSQTVQEQNDLALSGSAVADADVGTGDLLISLSASHGALTLASTAGLTFSAGDGASDARMVFTGKLAAVNAALATLRYRSEPFTGIETLVVSANDQGYTGGGALSVTKTIRVDVTSRPTDSPQSTPTPEWTPSSAPETTQTPVLVVVTPAPTVSVRVPEALPIGVATPVSDGVVAIVGDEIRGVGVLTVTPAAWGGQVVELQVPNEGHERVIDFQPLPSPTVTPAVPTGYDVSRTFSLEVLEYDRATNTARHLTDEEKRTAEPVVLRFSISRVELQALTDPRTDRPDASRFAILRVRPDGTTEPVPVTFLPNDLDTGPAGWLVASFVPRSTYLIVTLPVGERIDYGALTIDKTAWLEVSWRAGGRYFPETGFSVKRDAFWDYFQKRGGVATFGYPASREFVQDGFPVQIFQRAVMQQWPDGHITLLNLLDGESGATLGARNPALPAVDPALLAQAPSIADPDYATKAQEFVQANVPDEWDGQRVGFLDAYQNTVRQSDAFPRGGGDPNLLAGFDLEVWGLPTSRPVRDPNNHGFVFQRFQRGILHYDAACGTTQGVLLGDAWKRDSPTRETWVNVAR